MNVDGAVLEAVRGIPAHVVLKLVDVVSLDGTTVGAVLGFLGLVVTTVGGVYVATRTSRSEKASVALATLEKTRDDVYEDRLTQRDERIAYLEKDLTNCKLEKKLEREELEAENDKLRLELARLRGSQ